MYCAASSSAGRFHKLCSRLAISATCRRRCSAMSCSSALRGFSAPEYEAPGTLTMYQSSHAIAAASTSQKSIRRANHLFDKGPPPPHPPPPGGRKKKEAAQREHNPPPPPGGGGGGGGLVCRHRYPATHESGAIFSS